MFNRKATKTPIQAPPKPAVPARRKPIDPSPPFDGDWQAFTIDPGSWSREGTGRAEGDSIRTSMVVNHRDYTGGGQ